MHRAATKWLDLTFLLFAISLPCSLTGMQIFLGLGLGALLALWIGRRFQGLSRTPLDTPLSLLALAIALSLLLAPLPWQSFRTHTGWWLGFSYLLAYHGLRSERQLSLVLLSVFAVVLVASLLGIYQSYTGHFPLGKAFHPQIEQLLKPAPGAPGRYAAVGFLYSRLRFAHMLMFPICIMLGIAIEPIGWRRRAPLILLILVSGVAMLSTWVRTVPFAIAAGALLLIFCRFRRRTHRLAAVLSIGLLLALSVVLAPGLLKRASHSFEGSRDWGRLLLWQTALDLTSEHPLTGVGMGNFSRVASPLIDEKVRQMGLSRFSGVLAFAHSDLLNIQAEAGLLGALAYCFLFFAYFRAVLRALSRKNPAQWLLNGFLQGSAVAMLAYLLTSLFHDHIFFMEIGFNVWFYLGLSMAALSLQRWPDSAPCRAS